MKRPRLNAAIIAAFAMIVAVVAVSAGLFLLLMQSIVPTTGFSITCGTCLFALGAVIYVLALVKAADIFCKARQSQKGN